MKTKKNIKSIAALFLCVILMLTAGCAKGTEKEQTAGTTSGKALAEMNDIPADGIITKEQFQSVAGKEQKVQFKGTTEDGITYVWTYDCAKIQNPEDQNLKIDFTQENLEEIKKQANDANDALQMTMHGKGVICVPTLEVTLPQSWESNAAYLVKEQDGKLAKMSDVTVTNDKESTTLVMTVTSLDGDCYVIGGVTEEQNKGADAANQSSKKKDGKEQSQETQEESENATDSADADVSENAADENGENPAEENNDAGQDAGNDKKENGQKADAKDPGGDAADQEDTASASNTCTISISCATILDNMDNLKSSKAEFVPSDGWILAPTEVEFTEGESVHDVLQRVCKEAGIQMESSFTPVYNSAYVEGINNLYEFDCGELSGWMFSVNGWYPNYGCSKYTVNAGDEICWVYTCNLGKDVGDNSMY